MDNEKNIELSLSQNINQSDIQEYLKDYYGIEFVVNELFPAELENQGYRKMSLGELHYVEPLFELAPQLIVDKINKAAIERAFKAATENSFKCLLDPSRHLATIKGTSDVFIGSALDNVTNQVKGQARWLENDAVLSVPNVPNVALNAFNALSAVTGQYFMAQVNAKLRDIKDGIGEIKQYIDAVKQSELEAALQELYEIIEHIQFIKKDPERIRSTINQIEDIRKVARSSIKLYRNQIEIIIRSASKTDNEDVISENTNEIKKYMVQYRYAVYIYNLAQILKIYLNDIIDVEELSLFRNEIYDTVNQYKKLFDRTAVWAKKYLDEANSLNKVSTGQILGSAGTGIIVGAFSRNVPIAWQTASLVNDLFKDSRKKKKEVHIVRNDKYQIQMNDTELIDSLIAAMDKYIDLAGRKAEIVSVEGECYIKYIETE